MRKILSLVAVGVLAATSLALPLSQRASAATGSYYDWVSRDYNGGEANNPPHASFEIAQGVSSDGRYVLFSSAASDIVPNDTNGLIDLFRRDRQTGTTVRVSVSTTGQEGDNDTNSGSHSAAISGDGRYVAFMSHATTLVPNDTNYADVFLRDVQAGTTVRICGDNVNGCDSPAISRDGRFITYAFQDPSTYGGIRQLFRYEIATGDRRLVSENDQQVPGSDNTIAGSRLSADGRYVVFNSFASNLVAGDTNNKLDIFRRDMQTGEVVRVNVRADGQQANDHSQWPTVSDDGRYVTFTTVATNLASPEDSAFDLYIKDVEQGTLQLVGGMLNRAQEGTVTGDGTQVVFLTDRPGFTASDTNNRYDIFSWNHTTGVNTRLTDFMDNQANATYNVRYGGTSVDGKYTAFSTHAKLNPGESIENRDVFVHAIDTVRPTVTFTAPASFAGPFPDGPTVTVTASDNDSGLKIFVIHVYTSSNQLLNICGTATPAELAAGSKSCDLSSLPDGTYYIKAGAFDVAGNNRTINSGNFVIGQ